MTQRTQCDPAGAKLRVPVSTFFRNIYSTSPGCFTVCRDLYEYICVNLLQCILDALFQSFLFLFKKNIYFYFYFFCYFFNLIKQLFGVRIQQFTNDSKT